MQKHYLDTKHLHICTRFRYAYKILNKNPRWYFLLRWLPQFRICATKDIPLPARMRREKMEAADEEDFEKAAAYRNKEKQALRLITKQNKYAEYEDQVHVLNHGRLILHAWFYMEYKLPVNPKKEEGKTDINIKTYELYATPTPQEEKQLITRENLQNASQKFLITHSMLMARMISLLPGLWFIWKYLPGIKYGLQYAPPLLKIRAEKVAAVLRQDFFKAAECRDQELALNSKLANQNKRVKHKTTSHVLKNGRLVVHVWYYWERGYLT